MSRGAIAKRPSTKRGAVGKAKKRIGKGASRKAQEKSPVVKMLAILGRYLSGVAMVSVLFLGMMQVDWSMWGDKVQALVNKPVSNVLVKGEFNYLQKDSIKALVSKEISGNFVDIDLDGLQASLIREPWVQRVNVQRVWPDSLSIEVFEEVPIARWRNSGFINNEGEVVEIKDNLQLSHLPLFSGPNGRSEEITRTYLEISEMLKSRGFELKGINVDETLAWQVFLSNGTEVIFGQHDVLTKLRNFLLVYDEQLQTLRDSIARVDMRYSNGMAVLWRDSGARSLQVSR